MNFVDFGLSNENSSNIPTDQSNRRQEHFIKKILLPVGIILAIVIIIVTLTVTLVYTFKRKEYSSASIIYINPTTLQTHTLVLNDLSTTTTPGSNLHFFISVSDTASREQSEEKLVVVNPCVDQTVQYRFLGMPWQNYSLYSFDASLFLPSTLISLYITIYPPNVGCDWSLDIYPMDGRIIPLTGRPSDSVFGLYDQKQNSTVKKVNVSTINDWGGGEGKFTVGITGAWYGTAPIGSEGNGKMTICFSHP